MEDSTVIKLATIITLGVIVLTSVVGIILVAITTDRDVFRAEMLAAGGLLLIAGVGGLSWALRRRRWRFQVQREEEE